MFNENSGLVKIWVRLIQQDESGYTIDDVPAISNLRDVVAALIQETV
jgi:hypothetical protein